MLSVFDEVEDILDVLWVCLLFSTERELLCLTVCSSGRSATSLKHFLVPPGSASTVHYVYGALIYFLSSAGLHVCL